MPTVEEQLIANILAGDEASRTVYADWLDQHGRPDHAEFLRLQGRAAKATRTDPAFVATAARMRELAPQIDVRWRMQLARPAVEQCTVGFQIPCPADWGAMLPTARPDVRTCTACNKVVRYCLTEAEAEAAAKQGSCVVVDVAALRREKGVCTRCGHRNQPHHKFCFSCGFDLDGQPEPPPRRLAGAPLPIAPSRLPGPMPSQPTPASATSNATARSCAMCGGSNPSSFTFCGSCGTRL